MICRTSTAFLSIYRKKDPDMENPGSFFLLLLRVFKMSFAILMAAAWAKCGSAVVFSVCGPSPCVTDDIYVLEEKFLLISGFIYALFLYT